MFEERMCERSLAVVGLFVFQRSGKRNKDC